MDEYEKAAIIGHWRNGATTLEIAVITDLYFNQIERIIEEYQNQLNQKNN